MTLRLWLPGDFRPEAEFELPQAAVRHVQVWRLQPGDTLQVFDGRGAQWQAQLLSMGRRDARVRLLAATVPQAELPIEVILAVGMPANERMDSLVEKAAELGVAAIQPLMAQRSVLRLDGERASRRQAHWQAIAGAACEQCGRAVVPEIRPVALLDSWLAGLDAHPAGPRWLLSPSARAEPVKHLARAPVGTPLRVLSGPEGGFDSREEALAERHGFRPASLGSRVLRADTAPLALLAWIGLEV